MSGISSTPGGEVLVYETLDKVVRVDVRLEGDTVWLTQEQMGRLFGRERSVITKHIRNVFKEGELDRAAVCASIAHTAADGKTYQWRNGLLWKADGTRRFADNAMVALALLVAESEPAQKDLMIRLVLNLLEDGKP